MSCLPWIPESIFQIEGLPSYALGNYFSPMYYYRNLKECYKYRDKINEFHNIYPRYKGDISKILTKEEKELKATRTKDITEIAMKIELDNTISSWLYKGYEKINYSNYYPDVSNLFRNDRSDLKTRDEVCNYIQISNQFINEVDKEKEKAEITDEVKRKKEKDKTKTKNSGNIQTSENTFLNCSYIDEHLDFASNIKELKSLKKHLLNILDNYSYVINLLGSPALIQIPSIILLKQTIHYLNNIIIQGTELIISQDKILSNNAAGYLGELRVARELGKYPDLYANSDVLFNKNDNLIQIDNIVVCKKGIFILEVKNWKLDWFELFIDSNEELYDVIHFNGEDYNQKVKYSNPFPQIKKQSEYLSKIINEIKDKANITVDIPIISAVVMANGKLLIRNNSNKNVLNVDEIHDFIYNHQDSLNEDTVRLLQDGINNRRDLFYKQKVKNFTLINNCLNLIIDSIERDIIVFEEVYNEFNSVQSTLSRLFDVENRNRIFGEVDQRIFLDDDDFEYFNDLEMDFSNHHF